MPRLSTEQESAAVISVRENSKVAYGAGDGPVSAVRSSLSYRRTTSIDPVHLCG